MGSCPCLPHLHIGGASPVATTSSPSKVESKRLQKLQRKERQREESGHKKREKRRDQKKKRKDARRELLAAMSDEERVAFIEQEKAVLQVRQAQDLASLRRAFESGAPKVVVN